MNAVVQLCARGAFAHKIPPRDIEPDVTALWRIVDRLSTEESCSLSLHRGPLLECLERLQQVVALSKEDSHGRCS